MMSAIGQNRHRQAAFERVVLARLTDNLRPFWFVVGTIEGTVGDKCR